VFFFAFCIVISLYILIGVLLRILYCYDAHISVDLAIPFGNFANVLSRKLEFVIRFSFSTWIRVYIFVQFWFESSALNFF